MVGNIVASVTANQPTPLQIALGVLMSEHKYGWFVITLSRASHVTFPFWFPLNYMGDFPIASWRLTITRHGTLFSCGSIYTLVPFGDYEYSSYTLVPSGDYEYSPGLRDNENNEIGD